MTDQELANSLFAQQEQADSSTSQSLLTGLALADSADGKVLVHVDGAKRGASEDQSITLPTACPVSEGDKVIITLYGKSGATGKKGYVSGIIGATGGGGGDLSALTQRVTNLENRADTDEAKINDVITAVNALKWYRVYRFVPTGTNHMACLWYQPSTGFVYVGINVNGNLSTGWNYMNSGNAIPSALRPANAPWNTGLHDARNVIWSSPSIMVCSGSDGYLSVYTSSGGTSNEAGSVLYMVQPNLNYSSTYWTGPDISALALSRALAARVALGDGLDIQQQDLEKDVDAYNAAFDIIFGAETDGSTDSSSR